MLGLPQPGNLGRGKPQNLPENVLVVLAEAGRRQTDFRRRAGELEEHPGVAVHTCGGVVDFFEEAPLVQMREDYKRDEIISLRVDMGNPG